MNLGQLAYCAACYQGQIKRQGLGRLARLGDSTDPNLAAGDTGAAGDVAGATAAGAAGAAGFGFFGPAASAGATAGGQLSAGVGTGFFNFGQSGATSNGSNTDGFFTSLGKSLLQGGSQVGLQALSGYLNPQRPAAPAGSSIPGWVWPVGIGLGAVVLISALKGKKSAAPSTVVVK